MSRRSERQPVVASAAMPAPAPLEPEYEDGDDGDDAVHLKRRPWAAEEDEHLVLLVEEHGVKAWAKIAQFLHMRNGKQCRERYRNHLRPELCKGEWSVEEDTEIWNRVREVGTKWAAISELFMPTRTDNDIKNRWNSIIRKPKAPGGREWTHQETEQRMAFIGNAARTQVPCRPPARRYPARRRRRAAAAPAGPARPTHHATPTLTRRAACPSQERKRERQRTQEEKRKTQQPKSKHQPRAAHADGAMDDGESPSRGRRLFRSPNAGSPSGGALAEGALGASAPNSESLRRYFGEAAGDSVGTPAPVTAAAVGGGGVAGGLRRVAAPRAPPRAPRRSWGRRAPSSARRAPSRSPPRPSTSARRSAAWARPSSTASPPPASSARPCRWRSRWGPTARRSRRRAAMGGRAPTRRRRTSARGSWSWGARRGRGRIERGRIEREGERGEGLCVRGEATGESRRRVISK